MDKQQEEEGKRAQTFQHKRAGHSQDFLDDRTMRGRFRFTGTDSEHRGEGGASPLCSKQD